MGKYARYDNIDEKFILRSGDRRQNAKKNTDELCIRVIADNSERAKKELYRQMVDSHRNVYC